jgi:hypothetical protein
MFAFAGKMFPPGFSGIYCSCFSEGEEFSKEFNFEFYADAAA